MSEIQCNQAYEIASFARTAVLLCAPQQQQLQLSLMLLMLHLLLQLLRSTTAAMVPTCRTLSATRLSALAVMNSCAHMTRQQEHAVNISVQLLSSQCSRHKASDCTSAAPLAETLRCLRLHASAALHRHVAPPGSATGRARPALTCQGKALLSSSTKGTHSMHLQLHTHTQAKYATITRDIGQFQQLEDGS